MKNKTINKIKNPGKERAWFDLIINPLLDSLDDERKLLTEHNWTFRTHAHEARFEFIQEAQHYLDRDGNRNLKQMLGVFVRSEAT